MSAARFANLHSVVGVATVTVVFRSVVEDRFFAAGAARSSFHPHASSSALLGYVDARLVHQCLVARENHPGTLSRAIVT